MTIQQISTEVLLAEIHRRGLDCGFANVLDASAYREMLVNQKLNLRKSDHQNTGPDAYDSRGNPWENKSCDMAQLHRPRKDSPGGSESLDFAITIVGDTIARFRKSKFSFAMFYGPSLLNIYVADASNPFLRKKFKDWAKEYKEDYAGTGRKLYKVLTYNQVVENFKLFY